MSGLTLICKALVQINRVRIGIDSKALVQIDHVRIDIDSKALVQIDHVRLTLIVKHWYR